MADPQLARGIRAHVILPGKSGLPEDRFVTTWAFQAPGAAATETHEQEVAADLIEFFNVPPQGRVDAVGDSIGGQVNRQGCEVRTYRMQQAPPREVSVVPFSLTGGNSDSLPEEVALTLSFFSVRNLPRQRGRVFLGPLRSSIVTGTTVGRAFPDAAFRSTVAEAATRLVGKDLTRPEWCVMSKASETLFPVTEGWVDDAFDTQRRRGIKAVTRLVWP